MADTQHVIEIQLHANLLDINAALDGRHKIRFMLLCKKRRDLQAKLDPCPTSRGLDTWRLTLSKCGACDQPGVYGWQRWATPAEVQAWASDPSKLSVQAHETTAKVAVFACDDHVFRLPAEPDVLGAVDLDLMVITHGSDCSAPPTCNCQ